MTTFHFLCLKKKHQFSFEDEAKNDLDLPHDKDGFKIFCPKCGSRVQLDPAWIPLQADILEGRRRENIELSKVAMEQARRFALETPPEPEVVVHDPTGKKFEKVSKKVFDAIKEKVETSELPKKIIESQ